MILDHWTDKAIFADALNEIRASIKIAAASNLPLTLTAPPARSGPMVHVREPWAQRFLGKSCEGCGGSAGGWVQRQIRTPHRILRSALWVANLFPRGCSCLRVLFGGFVGKEVYASRMQACPACPRGKVLLTIRGGLAEREELYCSACQCPDTWLSLTRIRNWFKKWDCPLNAGDPIRRNDIWGDPSAPVREALKKFREKGDHGRP